MGRDEELGLLLGGLRYTVGGGALLAAIDGGERCVGKSRLVARNQQRQRGRPRPRGLLRALRRVERVVAARHALTTVLQLETTMTADEIRQQAAARAAEIVDRPLDDPRWQSVTDGFCHILNQPSALDDMDPARRKTDAVRDRGLPGGRLREPVMVAITDVHWADPSVLQLFEQVIASLAGLPSCWSRPPGPTPGLALAATIQAPCPPAPAPRPARPGGLPRAHRAILLGEGADSSTVSRLFGAAAATPCSSRSSPRWSPTPGEPPAADSLRALVAARLDQLPTDQRRCSTTRPCSAHQVPWVALRKRERPGFRATEQALTVWSKPVCWPSRAPAGGSARRARRRLPDADQGGPSAAPQRRGHPDGGTPPSRRSEDLAHHWATAADSVREIGRVTATTTWAQTLAVRSLTEAAERATEQMYPRGGYRLANRGVDLLEDQEGVAVRSQRRRLLLVRADASADLRWLAKSHADLEAALATALDDGDRRSTPPRIACSVRWSGWKAMSIGRACQSTSRCACGASSAMTPSSLAPYTSRGFVEVFGMTPSGAKPFLDEAEQIYTRLCDRGGLAWVEQNRAWASFLSGDVAEAETRLHKAA